ncbi:MAG: hypothetical protein JJU36_05075 [Phycisphaeraceae bacterium]|nr:hypothetical protein [Phycisphaeraceae bacterium]
MSDSRSDRNWWFKVVAPGGWCAALLLALCAIGLTGPGAQAESVGRDVAVTERSGDEAETEVGQASTTPAAPVRQISLHDHVQQVTRQALEEISQGAAVEPIQVRLTELFDSLIAHADLRQTQAFRDAAVGLRLAMQLRTLPESQRKTLAQWLLRHPDFARTLALTIRMGEENPRPILELVLRMIDRFGDRVAGYANLAVAIAVVHDQPLVKRLNENTARASDPLDLMAFYIANERAMMFGVRDVPPELLIHVVNTTASVDELTWALRRYRGDQKVGARFFDIRYDYTHFRQGAPKRVTVAGFNLPNILQHGGVCIDQAYFAASVGKAIGVPTSIVYGRGGNVSHAWIGFFETQGRRGAWNFDIGRYPEYQGIRGLITDPQTRQRVPDGFVSLQAEALQISEPSRHYSQALVDAAGRLVQLAAADVTSFGVARPENVRAAHFIRVPRTPGVETSLSMIDAALGHNAANLRAWATLRHLVENDQLDLNLIRAWAGKLEEFCGRRYPDFAAFMLTSMINKVPDIRHRDQLWDRAFMFFRSRADLAAEIRLAQGRMWEEAGDPRRAGRAYFDIIERYANDGPFVIDALQRSARMLESINEPGRLPELYARAFSQLRPPRPSAYNSQSNYYRVGVQYAQVLDRFGRSAEAREIRRLIGQMDTREASPHRPRG